MFLHFLAETYLSNDKGKKMCEAVVYGYITKFYKILDIWI